MHGLVFLESSFFAIKSNSRITEWRHVDDVLLWKFGGWDSIFVLPTGHSKNGYTASVIAGLIHCNLAKGRVQNYICQCNRCLRRNRWYIKCFSIPCFWSGHANIPCPKQRSICKIKRLYVPSRPHRPKSLLSWPNREAALNAFAVKMSNQPPWQTNRLQNATGPALRYPPTPVAASRAL